jgi:hypothetical protein
MAWSMGPRCWALVFVAWLAAGCAGGARHADRFDRACAARCALPPGLDLAKLPPEERDYYAARAVLCTDYECGRLSRSEYLTRLADLRYTELGAGPPAKRGDATTPVAVEWASSVISFSSEFETERWSAMNILGPPDTYPNHGNIPTAWCPLTSDGAVEYIELGFNGDGMHISGVDIYETHNPGAVSRVEVLGPGEEHETVYEARPAAMPGMPAFIRRITFRCTSFPLHALRLTVDSPAVPGWNEIDAVGVFPCVDDRSAPAGKVWTDE